MLYKPQSVFELSLKSHRNESVLVADNFQIAQYNANVTNEPLKVFQQRVLGYYDTFLAPQHVLAAVLDKTSARFLENGLTNQIISRWINFELLRALAEPEEPKVFTLEHLKIGFQIHCVFLSVAVLMFLIELSIIKGRLLIEGTKERLAMLVLKRFYELSYHH